jgi:hypothetical protein
LAQNAANRHGHSGNIAAFTKLLQGVEKRSERASGKEETGEKAEFTWRK